MVTSELNGRLKFSLAAAINLIPILITIIASAAVISSKVSNISTRLEVAEKHIIELQSFKNKGDRFTRQDGADLRDRILSIESKVLKAPPEWFQKMFSEFRVNMLNDVKELKGQVHMLVTEIQLLKTYCKCPSSFNDLDVGGKYGERNPYSDRDKTLQNK